MGCFVCESPTVVTDEHHVVMQSRGGREGPTVQLCPTCHSLTHRAANRMLTGKSYDDLSAHLSHEAVARLAILVKSIVVVETTREDPRNPNPRLSVVLDRPEYLTALAILQRDRGFTSRDRLVNELVRRIAVQYGLIDDEAEKPRKGPISLAELRRLQPK